MPTEVMAPMLARRPLKDSDVVHDRGLNRKSETVNDARGSWRGEDRDLSGKDQDALHGLQLVVPIDQDRLSGSPFLGTVRSFIAVISRPPFKCRGYSWNIGESTHGCRPLAAGLI